jgi:hypothetical protein
MNRRGVKWTVVAVSLALIVLGVHLAWERHRYRLETPKGIVRVGMKMAEVEAVFGPAWLLEAMGPFKLFATLDLDEGTLFVEYDSARLVTAASFRAASMSSATSAIPRQSLFEHVSSWFKDERTK